MTFLQAIPSIIPQPDYKIIKGGSNQKGVGNSYNAVTNMYVAPGYPPEVVIGGKIVIPDHVQPYAATVTALIQWSGGVLPKVNARIMLGSTAIVTGPESNSGNVAYASVDRIITPGETYSLFWRGEGSFFSYPSCIAGANTSLEIYPI